jgi:hypothetical protein
VICRPSTIGDCFAETPIPAGPISDEAADAIARILWEAVEDNTDRQAEQGGAP